MLHKKFLLTQCLIWLSFALLTRFTWLDTRPPSWTWIGLYMGLGLVFSSILAVLYSKKNALSILQAVILSLISSVLIGLLWRVCFNALEFHVLESANNAFKFWGYFHNGKSAVTQLLVWSFGFWLIAMQQRQQQDRELQQTLRLEAKEAQLKMLQYQIAPHFLFNVLSGIDTLLLKKDYSGARDMLNKLSKYLKQTLENEGQSSISLKQELSLCQKYLDVERSRFRDKLTLNWNITRDVPDCQLPNGVLLPLFENALKHGRLAHAENAIIDVKLLAEDDKIKLKIGNDISPDGKKQSGFGLGLKNTEARIKRFFGKNAEFSTRQNTTYFEAQLILHL